MRELGWCNGVENCLCDVPGHTLFEISAMLFDFPRVMNSS
jgi:hypothetical protein